MHHRVAHHAAGVRVVLLALGRLVLGRRVEGADRVELSRLVQGGGRALGLAAFCDVADAVTTVATWRRLPSPGRLLVSAAAAGAAVVGVAAVAVATPDRRATGP